MNSDQIVHLNETLQRSELELRDQPEGLTLCGFGMELRADFTEMIPRLLPNRLNAELIVKACRLRGVVPDGPYPVVVDATAGFGEDSLLLAAAGFEVILYEHDPVIAALLADALRRAKEEPALCHAAARMQLHVEDSIAALRSLPAAPDLVYLDPMFPKRKKSGLIKKKFQLLQKLEQPEPDGTALLEAAIAAGPRRIVIKRPAKGPVLGGRKPDYVIRGSSIRCDCIVLPRRDH